MKAYVIACNRLTWLQNICFELKKRGCEVIILDNASTYAPLLDWYQNDCKYAVKKFKNIGRLVVWQQDIKFDERYIVTDHDLDISKVPMDMIEKLSKALDENPNKTKAGLSLKINDLDIDSAAWKNEIKFWQTAIDENTFDAEIDTTLAMYDHKRLGSYLKDAEDLGIGNKWYSAVRLNTPYTAIHLPWYNVSKEIEDEENYYKSATGRIKYFYVK